MIVLVRGAKRVLAMNDVAFRKLSSVAILKGASLWSKYNHHLHVNPIITKGITGGVIAVAADILCQAYFPDEDKEVKKKPILQRIDWYRSFNFSILAMLPIGHYWYAFLSTKIVGDNLATSALRVLLDQAVFTPVLLGFVFAITSVLQDQSHLIADKLRVDLPATLKSNYLVWIPAQLINFSVVPPQLRVLCANFVGFFWSIYMSSVLFKKSAPRNAALALDAR